MRVLFVTNMWPDEERPWYGTFVKSQADSLRALGVDIDLLAIRGYRSRSEYAKAVMEVRRRTRASEYDVVHAHYGHAGAVGRLQLRAPLVISYCGDDLLGTPTDSGGITLRSRVEAALFRELAWVAAATITKSEQMERALPGRCRHRNHVIPNGVDLERFKPVPRAEARRALEWPERERTVLFVGNPAIARKNHSLADAVCREAATSVPELRLRVAWETPPEHVPLMMSAADALLLTSRWEGSPNVIKEAMAAELPVVATPVGDVQERLRDVDGCFVVPPDAGALSGALAAALENGRAPQARAAIGSLSLESVARRVLRVYEGVKEQPGPDGPGAEAPPA
jgi:glycosyltransferase involved in cell wall biosynthesis